MDEYSILDQIIENKQNQVITEFNPKTILDNLASNLSDREGEVLYLRYGLEDPEKNTLEEIGKKFQVTRERIRQIESSALKKIKNHQRFGEIVKPADQLVKQILEEHGGLMRHDFLVDKVLFTADNREENRNLISFIINYLLATKLSYLPETAEIYAGWKLPTVEIEKTYQLLNFLITLFNQNNEPLTIKIISTTLKNEQNYAEVNEKVIHSLLVISKKIEKNPFDEWGLTDWQSIMPKRMSDKIYLILKKVGQPLHFTEIAKRINEVGFDNKKANPATIHNELILDKKYVLIGRGIYALKDWGYQPGVVADVIKQILKNYGPLTKDEIINKVLEKRRVKKSTINLALMNKTNFLKQTDKKYSLANR